MKDITFLTRERMYLTDDGTKEVWASIKLLPELHLVVNDKSFDFKEFENFEVINQELESKHDLKLEDMFYEKITFCWKEYEGSVMKFKARDCLYVDIMNPDGSYLSCATEISPSEYTLESIGLNVEKVIVETLRRMGRM